MIARQGINFIIQDRSITCGVINSAITQDIKLHCQIEGYDALELEFENTVELKDFLIKQNEINDAILAELEK